MELTTDYFIDDIFQLEAEGIFQDIMVSTLLKKYLKNLNQLKVDRVTQYIKNIFKEYYKLGNLNVLIYDKNTTLYGYAFFFTSPSLSQIYLHKIFVYEQYRNKGLGRKILSDLSDNGTITLLCPKNKENFYVKNNFKYIRSFETSNNKNFQMSKILYTGLSVMCNSSEQNNISIFLLDDTDIKNIANVLRI